MTISSKIMGRPFDLYVNLPRNYVDTTGSFPVVYLLDGQWDFPLLNAVFGEQFYDGFLPGMIVVGIAWGGGNPNYDSLRARDLTPTWNKQIPQSGNGPNFLKFIKSEVIPFVESRYRALDHDRTLMGSSFGGLFTLYAMFEETSLFSRYVLTSPALGWDNAVMDKIENSYAGKNSRLPVRLFMAVGGLEWNVPKFQGFVDRLKSRKYEGLDLQSAILPGIGHSGSKAEGYTMGLQHVFARPSLSLAPELLRQYTGVYRLPEGQEMRIEENRDRLVVHTPEGETQVLQAETATDFYVKGTFYFLRFRKDQRGNVSGLQLVRFTGAEIASRIRS